MMLHHDSNVYEQHDDECDDHFMMVSMRMTIIMLFFRLKRTYCTVPENLNQLIRPIEEQLGLWLGLITVGECKPRQVPGHISVGCGHQPLVHSSCGSAPELEPFGYPFTLNPPTALKLKLAEKKR